jgi:hypothetical protein
VAVERAARCGRGGTVVSLGDGGSTDLGGWAIGVVGDGDDSDHRRSSGGGEESRRWGGVGGAASARGI